jgi:hypothetical protein
LALGVRGDHGHARGEATHGVFDIHAVLSIIRETPERLVQPHGLRR